MGEVTVKIEIAKFVDVAHALKTGKSYKHLDIDALVDTGAVLILLPQEMIEALDLIPGGKTIVTLANEQKVELPKFKGLHLKYKDREGVFDCLSGP